MPKLEFGDLAAVARAKEINIPILAAMVDDGWDIVTPVPSSCTEYRSEDARYITAGAGYDSRGHRALLRAR